MCQNVPKQFSARLRWLREKRGINRKVLSELCGLSKNMIARYERGEQEPTLTVIVEIAEFFDVSADFLLFGK